jgi:hypothetical protein
VLDRYSRKFLIMLSAGLSLAFACAASSAADLATLSGTVVDSAGAVIPNTHVIVHWDSAGLDGVKDNIGVNDDKSATTDAAGHFSLELPPGVYDVFVASAGFFPRCEKLTIKVKEIHPYRVQLEVSKMTTTVMVN